MPARTIRYLISPRTACPPALTDPRGRPVPWCELDLGDVALCSWGEVLQTAPAGNPFLSVFEELLVPGRQELVWRGDGPGRGVEMRRAFSGMFGRFFARAYLSRYHDFTWFTPINRNPTYVSLSLRIKKRNGSERIDLPDWICGGTGQLAIAEAKGSHQKASLREGTRPGPIRTADAQIQSVRVQMRRGRVGNRRWVSQSIEGWAAMSRWGLETPARDPFLFVLDPETHGEPLREEEKPGLVQQIAREHVRQTLEGLGYGDLVAEPEHQTITSPRRERQEVALNLAEDVGRRFIGAVASPVGLLPWSVGEAQALMSSQPFLRPLRLFFVGFDVDVIKDILSGRPVSPRPRRDAEDGTRVGRDGLLIAPLERVSPVQPSI
jgi:hypothetical protein